MHEDDLLNGLRNAGERLDRLSQPVDPHAARLRAAPGTPARRGVRAGVAVAAAVALVGLVGAVALRDDESQVTMIDDPVTTSTSTTSRAASAPPCPVIDERSPRVGDQVLGVVPPGFTAGAVTEGGDGRAVDAGGTSTYTIRLNGPNDAVIEVTSFSASDPGALLGSLLGEVRDTALTPGCRPSPGEEARPRRPVEWAEVDDLIVVGAQQWEWGGFYVTGTGVDLATLLELAGGLLQSSSAVPPGLGSCPSQGRTSPAVFDDRSGTYAAQSVTFDDSAGVITFDVVQWLSGQDAWDAYLREHPDDPSGPPNDYMIINEDPRTRSLPLGDGASILLLGEGASLGTSFASELGDHLQANGPEDVYWLTVDAGVVTELCQQYRP